MTVASPDLSGRGGGGTVGHPGNASPAGGTVGAPSPVSDIPPPFLDSTAWTGAEPYIPEGPPMPRSAISPSGTVKYLSSPADVIGLIQSGKLQEHRCHRNLTR